MLEVTSHVFVKRRKTSTPPKKKVVKYKEYQAKLENNNRIASTQDHHSKGWHEQVLQIFKSGKKVKECRLNDENSLLTCAILVAKSKGCTQVKVSEPPQTFNAPNDSGDKLPWKASATPGNPSSQNCKWNPRQKIFLGSFLKVNKRSTQNI